MLRRIKAGWFDSLGVTAIWMTPFVEQVHGSVDEGTGKTWGYHGYWTRDWTAVDPALGTARRPARGGRRGPPAPDPGAHGRRGQSHRPGDAVDPAWPADWVRANPNCSYKDYATTVTCNLVKTLPDILTERNDSVGLPPALVEKWTQRGTARSRAGRSWRRSSAHGISPRAALLRHQVAHRLGARARARRISRRHRQAFRGDGERRAPARKPTSPSPTGSATTRRRSSTSFPSTWWARSTAGRRARAAAYNFGDRSVDFFAFGYDALINFGFKREAGRLARLALHAVLGGPARPARCAGVSFVNYVTNHDDGQPYDLESRAIRSAPAPGCCWRPAPRRSTTATRRPGRSRLPGTEGDANLRSIMNWGDQRGDPAAAVLRHWQRLGQFRHDHPAVGAGVHRRLQEITVHLQPDAAGGSVSRSCDRRPRPGRAARRSIPVFGLFPDGTELLDSYSGTQRPASRTEASTFTTPYGLLAPEPNRLDFDSVALRGHRHAVLAPQRELQSLDAIEARAITRAPAPVGRSHPVAPLARKPLRQQHATAGRKSASGTTWSLHVLSTGIGRVQQVPSSSISVTCSDWRAPRPRSRTRNASSSGDDLSPRPRSGPRSPVTPRSRAGSSRCRPPGAASERPSAPSPARSRSGRARAGRRHRSG